MGEKDHPQKSLEENMHLSRNRQNKKPEAPSSEKSFALASWSRITQGLIFVNYGRFYDLPVCFGECKISQLTRFDPAPVCTAQSLRISRLMSATKSVEGDSKMRVGMLDGADRFANLDPDSQLFPDSILNTAFQGFIRILPAPRELPKPTQQTLPGSLNDEKSSAFVS